MGRPRKPDARINVTVRFAPSELAGLRAAAADRGVTLSELVRSRALRRRGQKKG